MSEFNPYAHTPAPWCYAFGAAYKGTEDEVVAAEYATDGARPLRLLLADRSDARTRPVERDANLRRAVACVNACEGIDDPTATLAEVRAELAGVANMLDACAAQPGYDGFDRIAANLRGILARLGGMR
jgi:hypothetical protein